MADAIAAVRTKVQAVIANLSPEPNHPEGSLLALAIAFDGYLAEAGKEATALADEVSSTISGLEARLADLEKLVNALNTPVAPAPPNAKPKS